MSRRSTIGLSLNAFGSSVWTFGMLSALLGLTNQPLAYGAAPSAKALVETYKPVQKDVEIETPTAAQLPKCKVEPELSPQGKPIGWVLLGPEGQVLRKFVDTNGDGNADQFRYYNLGMEVYRDLDTNFNDKIDQSRWVNLGGSRWGIDANEDRRIDNWKVISAAEASREAVRALIEGDEVGLRAVMITSDDLRTLGLSSSIAKSLLELQSELPRSMKSVLTKSKVINSKSRWARFDAQQPGLIPADERKATADLLVYENAMAIIDNAGQSALIQIGEIIQVGDAWKLTQCPRPLEANEVIAGGVLMQPLINAGSGPIAGGAGPSPEAQKILDDLQKLDQRAPAVTAKKEALKQYNEDRIALLMNLIKISSTAEEKEQAMKQMIDGVAASVQSGGYPDGIEKLKSWESSLKKQNSELVSYVAYRRMMSDYSLDIQAANDEKRSEVHKEFMKDLAQYVTQYAKTEEAADAMMQIASAEELSGRLSEAKVWYQRLAKEKGDTLPGKRAAGALRRLDLKDRPLQLSGPGINGGKVDISQYRGKNVLVMFWTTWCVPCTEDLPQLRALYEQYRSRGFEIVGVCLDVTPEGVPAYLQQHKVTWPQIFEPGGFDAGLGLAYGIITVPTMLMVDEQGKVVSRASTLQDVKTALADRLAAGKASVKK